MYSESNFMHGTYAVFKGCKLPARKPDFISESGSQYWYAENKNGRYVIRASNHWSGEPYKLGCKNIASCYWPLKTTQEHRRGTVYAGKAYFRDFAPVKWR